MNELIEKIKNLGGINIAIYILVGLLILQIGFKLFNRFSSNETIESKTLIVLKVSKVCVDKPGDLTECIDLSPRVYKVVHIPEANNPEQSIVYLRIK